MGYERIIEKCMPSEESLRKLHVFYEAIYVQSIRYITKL